MKPDTVQLTPEQAEFVSHAERLLAEIPKTHKWKATHCRLALDGGGPCWRGWSFGPFGHAGEFRLFGPDGAHYTPDEIVQVRRLELDADYRQGRIKELEALTAPGSVSFSPSEAATLAAAASIIKRAVPRENTRRLAPVLNLAKTMEAADGLASLQEAIITK